MTRRSLLVVVLITVVIAGLSAARASAQTTGFVYALKDAFQLPNQIYGFSIDTVTGVLTALPGFPIATGGNGGGLVFAKMVAYANGRLFVVNGGSDTLSVYSVNRTTGALTPLPFSPIALGSGDWGCVAVHPSGSPVLVGDELHKVASFVMTATSATPAAGSPFSMGAALTYSCGFSQDGNYFYAGGGGDLGTPLFAGFSVAPATGVLTPLPGSPYDSGATLPMGYATDDAGRLFTVNFTNIIGSDTVRVYTTNAGVPTGVTGNPFASGVYNSTDGILHPDGFYMVANRGFGANLGEIGVYRISGAGAATTASAVTGSPFASGGTFAGTLALSPDGRFLIVGHATTSRNLAVFNVNATTGALTSLHLQPVNTLGTAGFVVGVAYVAANSYPFDLDADRKTDVGVFTSGGVFSILKSTTNYALPPQQFSWGLGTDVPVPADYDGDRKHDIAVFRNGVWWILYSSSNYTTHVGMAWGAATDIPVPADYDGDGKADLAVFRPSDGVWWILQSRSNYATYVAYQWGAGTDKPVPADYDSDGQADIAIYRPSAGQWWILHSTLNYATYSAHAFGASGDIAVPGDFDADGKTDLGVFRPSEGRWYVLVSQSDYASFLNFGFGLSTDILVPADYDGDGKTDVAVYRASAGIWYLLTSSSNYTTLVWYVHGASTDIPLPRR